MIICKSPKAYYERCVAEMDGLQSCGRTIDCNMAEELDYDTEQILQQCEQAEIYGRKEEWED